MLPWASSSIQALVSNVLGLAKSRPMSPVSLVTLKAWQKQLYRGVLWCYLCDVNPQHHGGSIFGYYRHFYLRHSSADKLPASVLGCVLVIGLTQLYYWLIFLLKGTISIEWRQMFNDFTVLSENVRQQNSANVVRLLETTTLILILTTMNTCFFVVYHSMTYHSNTKLKAFIGVLTTPHLEQQWSSSSPSTASPPSPDTISERFSRRVTLKMVKQSGFKVNELVAFFDKFYFRIIFVHVILNVLLVYNQVFGEATSYWRTLVRFLALQFQLVGINFLVNHIYTALIVSYLIVSILMRTVKHIRQQFQKSIIRMSHLHWIPLGKARKQVQYRLLNRMQSILTFYCQMLIHLNSVDKHFGGIFLLAMAMSILDSQIALFYTMNLPLSSKTQYLFLLYMLSVQYGFLFCFTFYTAKTNSTMNGVIQDLFKCYQQMDRLSGHHRHKFRFSTHYQILATQKPFGATIGGVVVVTKAMFVKLVISYLRYALLMQKLMSANGKIDS